MIFWGNSFKTIIEAKSNQSVSINIINIVNELQKLQKKKKKKNTYLFLYSLQTPLPCLQDFNLFSCKLTKIETKFVFFH